MPDGSFILKLKSLQFWEVYQAWQSRWRGRHTTTTLRLSEASSFPIHQKDEVDFGLITLQGLHVAYSLRCLIYKEPKNLALTCEVLIDFSISFISSRQIDLAWHKCVDTESFGNVDSNHNDRCFFFGYLIAYIFLNHRIFILQSKDSKIPRPIENRIIWRCYNSISS